jgi:hypothetical protein
MDWPGLWSPPERIGAGSLEFSRPEHFFRANGVLPERSSMDLVAPPGFASDTEFGRALAAALAERERTAVAAREADGSGILGVDRVLAQPPSSRPSSGERRRELRPRVACRDKWKRIEALGRLVEFLRCYRKAWNAWRTGALGVVFPAGTYLVRVTHGVACAAEG